MRVQTSGKAVELAWAAGFFDGEGCVSLYSSRSEGLRLTLRIVNTDRRAIEKFASIVGDGKLRRDPARGIRQASWRWYLGAHSRVGRILRELRPHLVVKASDADLALAFLGDTDPDEQQSIFEALRARKTRWPGSRRERGVA